MRHLRLDQLKHSSSLIRAFAALSAWRSHPLSACSKVPDQTGWMPRLIWKRSPSWFCQTPNWLLINEVNFPECRHMIQCGFMVCRNVSDEYCVFTLVFRHTYLRGNYSAETNNRFSVKIHMSVCWSNQQTKTGYFYLPGATEKGGWHRKTPKRKCCSGRLTAAAWYYCHNLTLLSQCLCILILAPSWHCCDPTWYCLRYKSGHTVWQHCSH